MKLPVLRESQPKSLDEKRLDWTYRIGVLVLVGGFALLIIDTPGVMGGEKLAFFAGAATSVFTFVFKREESSDSARHTLRAVGAGSTTVNASGSTTVEGGDPTVVNRA